MKKILLIILSLFIITTYSIVPFVFAANIPDLESLPDGIDNFPNKNYDSKEYLLYKENSTYGLLHFQSEPINLRYRVLESSCDLTPRVNTNKYRFDNGEWRYSSTVSDVSLIGFSTDFAILYSTVDVYDADGNIIRIADEETFGSDNSDNEDSEIPTDPEHGGSGMPIDPDDTLDSGWYFPLEGSGWTITSPFGYRIHPIYGDERLHTGVDVAKTNCGGLEIYAARDGVVTSSYYDSSGGNMIVIDHGDGFVTKYLHMRDLSIYSSGDEVSAGDVIGYVGTTGDSTGDHLHFSIMKDGEYVDPEDYIDFVNGSGSSNDSGIFNNLWQKAIKPFLSQLFSPILKLIETINEAISSSEEFQGTLGDLFGNFQDYTIQPIIDYLNSIDLNTIAFLTSLWEIPIVKDILFAIVVVMVAGAIIIFLGGGI